jgi:glycerophosphoryl diester phosphodiesterase
MAPKSELPEIIAHRGNASEFPENTLQSLQSAVEFGIRHVEFDVQLTQDKVPVLLHDADLARVGGRPESVHDLSWVQLSEIPVGEVKRLGRRHAFTYPPSLAQTVDLLTDWPQVTAFVEIKRASLRHFGRETVLRRVSEVLKPVADRCVVISFDLPSIQILRAMTGTRIGWVLETYDDGTRAAVDELSPEFLFCNLARLPDGTTQLWPGAWEWALYEVRDVTTAAACGAMGAGFVESMAIGEMLAAYGAASSKWLSTPKTGAL